MSQPNDTIDFAVQLVELMHHGRNTATYKYAVLLGLIDAVVSSFQDSGAPPTSVTTRQLAEKVIDLYWGQARHYTSTVASQALVLKQNVSPNKQARILKWIVELRREHPKVGTTIRARGTLGGLWEDLVDKVEWKLIQEPLPRLHLLRQQRMDLVYTIGWQVGVKKRPVTAYQRGLRQGARTGDFDNTIRFVGDAAYHLSRLVGVLRPLIQREWTRMVARINGLEQANLEAFLFDPSRTSLEPVRKPLRELHGNRCFYCQRDMSRRIDIDHFIPWSRSPNDGLANLVPAHPGCNNHKRDHLAAHSHLERWLAGHTDHADAMEQLADAIGWRVNRPQSLSMARSLYLELPANTLLWVSKTDAFAPSEPDTLRALLNAA